MQTRKRNGPRAATHEPEAQPTPGRRIGRDTLIVGARESRVNTYIAGAGIRLKQAVRSANTCLSEREEYIVTYHDDAPHIGHVEHVDETGDHAECWHCATVCLDTMRADLHGTTDELMPLVDDLIGHGFEITGEWI